MWVLGNPREGKSRLLEHLIKQDISRLQSGESQAGVCVIDPSEKFSLGRRIVNFCAEIGYGKVLLIDPTRIHTHKKIAPINTLLLSEEANLDIYRVLFGVTDPSGFAFIETYLPMIIRVLRATKTPWGGAICFTGLPDSEKFDEYSRDREELFLKAEKFGERLRRDVYNLRKVYGNYNIFSREIGSTVRRVAAVFNSDELTKMFSFWNGVKFAPLITKGWVTLVNTSALGVMPGRMLATSVINGLLEELSNLYDKGYSVPYFMYIDEAGEYATRKLARVLELKAKTGARLILANQFPGQFEDKRVRESIETNIQLKIMFHIDNAEQRLAAIKVMNYGGAFNAQTITHQLGNQPKRKMIVKLPKQYPKMDRVPDVKDYEDDPEFVERLLKYKVYEPDTPRHSKGSRTEHPHRKAARKADESGVREHHKESPKTGSVWTRRGKELRMGEGKALANPEDKTDKKPRTRRK